MILGKLDPFSKLVCEPKVVDFRFDAPINYLIKWCATPGVQNCVPGAWLAVPWHLQNASIKLNERDHGDALCLLCQFVPWKHPEAVFYRPLERE